VASVAQCRVDLAARADVISGLKCYDKIPETIDPPSFVVGPLDSMTYNLTAGPTGAIWVFLCRLYAARADSWEAQILLDSFVAPTGASSIKAALEVEATSNTSSSHWTNVREARGFAVYSFGGVDYLGCEFVVEMAAA